MAFVNTGSARPENRQQGAESYAELVAWGREVGVLSPDEAKRLLRRAGETPADAAATFARAAKLRFALARLFNAMTMAEEPPRAGLDGLNAAMKEAMPALRVVPGEAGVVWGWEGDDDDLGRVLWPVVLSAAETLIAAAGRPHVRQCAAKGCRLYFVDRGPKRQRRWCDMKVCGNRAKVSRHYRRQGMKGLEEELPPE